MESASHDDENRGTDPVTPVKAATNKRLAMASPFSSASPQNRRPLKARNFSNEGDDNLEATMMNESTFLDASTAGHDQSLMKQDDSPLDEIEEEELDVTLSDETEKEMEPVVEETTSSFDNVRGMSLADELGGLQDSSFVQTEKNVVKMLEGDANLEDTVMNVTVPAPVPSLADELGSLDTTLGQETENIPPVTAETTDSDSTTTVAAAKGLSLADELGGLCDTSFVQAAQNLNASVATAVENENKLEASMNAATSLSDELAGLMDTSTVSTGEKESVESVPASTDSDEIVGKDCGSDTLELSDIIGPVSYTINTSTNSAPGLTSLASELAGIVSDETLSPKRSLELSKIESSEDASEAAQVEAVSLTEEHSSETTFPPDHSFTDYLAAPPPERQTADVTMVDETAEEMASDKSSFTPNDDSDRTPTRERSQSGPGRLSPTNSEDDVVMPLNSFMASPVYSGRASKHSESMLEFLIAETEVAREDDIARDAELKTLKEEVPRLKEMIASLEEKLAKETKTRDLAEKEREDFKYMFEDTTTRGKKKETEFRRQIMDLEDRLRENEEKGEGSKALQEQVDLAQELVRSSKGKQQRLVEDLNKLQEVVDGLTQVKTQYEAEAAQLKEALEVSTTELTTAKHSIAEVEQRWNEQTSRVAELETSVQDCLNERNLAVKEANVLREKLEDLSSQETASQGRVREAEDQAIKLIAQVKELETSLETLRKNEEMMTEELTTLRQKLDAPSSQEELEIVKERALAAEGRVEEVTTQLQQVQATLLETQNACDAAVEETAMLRNKLEESPQQDELESMKEEARVAAKEKEELANTISQLEKTVQDVESHKEEIERNFAALQEKFDKAIQQAESLSGEHEEMRQRQEAADTALLQEKAVGKELRSKLEIVSEERSAIEVKLVQAEQAVALHKKTVDDLREQLRVLTSDSEASQDAVKIKCAELEMKLEMAESQLSSLPTIREQLKTARVSNVELETKIEICRKNIGELNDTKNKLAEAQDKVEELEIKLKVIGSEGGAQEEKQKELSDRITAQTEAMARMEEEKAEIQERLSQKTAELTAKAAETQEAIARADAEMEEVLVRNSAEIETLRRQLDTVAAQAAESTEANARLTTNIKELEKELQERRRRSAINVLPAPVNKSAEDEKLKSKIEELEKALEKEKAEAEKAWRLCDEADDKEAEFQRRISALLKENENLKGRLGETTTGGLLDVLRPAGTKELPLGSPVADKTGISPNVSLNTSTHLSMGRSSPAAADQTLATHATTPPKKKTTGDKTCQQQ